MVISWPVAKPCHFIALQTRTVTQCDIFPEESIVHTRNATLIKFHLQITRVHANFLLHMRLLHVLESQGFQNGHYLPWPINKLYSLPLYKIESDTSKCTCVLNVGKLTSDLSKSRAWSHTNAGTSADLFTENSSIW